MKILMTSIIETDSTGLSSVKPFPILDESLRTLENILLVSCWYVSIHITEWAIMLGVISSIGPLYNTSPWKIGLNLAVFGSSLCKHFVWRRRCKCCRFVQHCSIACWGWRSVFSCNWEVVPWSRRSSMKHDLVIEYGVVCGLLLNGLIWKGSPTKEILGQRCSYDRLLNSIRLSILKRSNSASCCAS